MTVATPVINQSSARPISPADIALPPTTQIDLTWLIPAQARRVATVAER